MKCEPSETISSAISTLTELSSRRGLATLHNANNAKLSKPNNRILTNVQDDHDSVAIRVADVLETYLTRLVRVMRRQGWDRLDGTTADDSLCGGCVCPIDRVTSTLTLQLLIPFMTWPIKSARGVQPRSKGEGVLIDT